MSTPLSSPSPTPPPYPPPRRFRISRILVFAVLLTLPALLVLRLILFQGPTHPPQPLPSAPIIDLHCHTAGIGAGDSGCFISPALRQNFRFRIYLQAFGVTEADLLQHGDALVLERLETQIANSRHVHAAVVLALDLPVDDHGQPRPDLAEIYIPNDFLTRELPRHPHLLFGASIHPLRPDAIERLDRAVAQGAVLVKWIPSIMNLDPADPRCIPFYQRLRHHHIPLLSHTGRERSFTRAEDDLADPARLRLALEHGVTVIAAHAGADGDHDGQSDFDRLRTLMREFPSLHADISALTQINKPGALRDALLAPECRGRLLYGSDFPLINTALVSPWYHPLQLTETQRRDIADIQNPWDRDIALKQALGVPPEIFAQTATLLPSRNKQFHPKGETNK